MEASTKEMDYLHYPPSDHQRPRQCTTYEQYEHFVFVEVITFEEEVDENGEKDPASRIQLFNFHREYEIVILII